MGYSILGILQSRIPEWAAISSSRGFSDSGIKLIFLVSPALAGGFFATAPPGNSCFIYHLSIEESKTKLTSHSFEEQ